MANSIKVSELPDIKSILEDANNPVLKDTDILLIASGDVSYKLSYGTLYKAIASKVEEEMRRWIDKVITFNSIAELRKDIQESTDSKGDPILSAVGWKAGKEMLAYMDDLSANLSCARWA